jgi:hypothetical protein
MSLYGTGRREGIVAVTCIGLWVVAAHQLAVMLSPALQGRGTALAESLLPALGGMLAYRFLRAQGRSRYAGFLAGAAYGLSPWLMAIAAAPREQLAAVLAPLALEAANRCDRPQARRQWLPWTWLCLALPFAAGLTVIGVLTFGLALASLLRTVAAGDRDEALPPARGLGLATFAAILAAVQFVRLDPLLPWLGPRQIVDAAAVLTPHRVLLEDIDSGSLLRVPGAMLLCFTVLGLLRRQRNIDGVCWTGLLVAGALPALCVQVPALAKLLPSMLAHPQLPASALWLCLLAATALGAAGLDDFLDQPMRRPKAHPWFFVGTLLLALLVPLGSRWPEAEWPLSLAWVGLVGVMPLWRRLGILRFKTALSIGALATLLLPLVQTTGHAVPWVAAAPALEIRVPLPPDAPKWHVIGLVSATCLTIGWALFALRRRRKMPAVVAGAARLRPRS